LLGKARRVLRFPDMRMAYNFTASACLPAVAPTEHALRIVDVGACVGGWTVAQLLAAPNAVFDCFEPNPAAWPYFRNNCAWNKNIRLQRLAVSDVEGEIVTLHVDPENMGKTSLYGTGTEIAAQAVTLDEFIKGRVDILKIDAEGHELHVLAGAERLLRQERPVVIVEVLGQQMARGGWTENDLIAFMAAHDYSAPARATNNDWLFQPRER